MYILKFDAHQAMGVKNGPVNEFIEFESIGEAKDFFDKFNFFFTLKVVVEKREDPATNTGFTIFRLLKNNDGIQYYIGEFRDASGSEEGI